MQTSPTIAVLMPVRNGSRYLEKAILSICGQTRRDFELIVIDDGSHDDSVEIVQNLIAQDGRIRLLQQPPQGIQYALNLGLNSTACSLVARMDGDDIAMPNRIELQACFLQANPQCVVVGGQTVAIDEEDEELFQISHPMGSETLEQSLLSGSNGLSHPAVMYRREAVLRVGGYQDEYPTDDYGLWLRLLDQGTIENVPEVVLKYRVHARDSSIEKHASQRQATLRIISRARQLRGMEPMEILQPDYSPRSVAGIHHHWAMSAVAEGRWGVARKHALKALGRNPFSLHPYWTLAKTFLHITGLRNS